MMKTTSDKTLPAAVRALANADFSALAEAFENAGFAVRLPAPGILQVCQSAAPRQRLLLSVAIHGDETAPVELLARMLDALAAAPRTLGVDLMVVVGNIEALAAGKRFLDADLNRLFCDRRGDLSFAGEAGRADAIMDAARDFLMQGERPGWHIDLHTAIRPSHYPAFAVLPNAGGMANEQAVREWLEWMGQAGIGAAILNRKLVGAFSAWTAQQCAAQSITLELGKAGAFGTNHLDRFAATQAAIGALLHGCGLHPGGNPARVLPHVFEVTQELVKHSDAFQMTLAPDTPNFTPLQPGTVIAQDGEVIYRVGERTEHVVFPNPGVRTGLRAGLMVVRCA